MEVGGQGPRNEQLSASPADKWVAVLTWAVPCHSSFPSPMFLALGLVTFLTKSLSKLPQILQEIDLNPIPHHG